MNPCDICIDEKCNGKKNCDCLNCKMQSECNKYLKPTIRITTKCTQSCSHCCFSCSPEGNKMMSLKMARKIKLFLDNNEIKVINLMGGEFFCNPDWFGIIDILAKNLIDVRLVTNGDWANSYKLKEILLLLLKANNNIHLSISKDKWHTNQYIDLAEQFCLDNNIKYNVATKEETTNDSIVPIGKSKWETNFYSLFACHCEHPDKHYSFLIDENGTIFKCGFGIWDYANIDEYLQGGFAKRFKRFNQVFYNKTFIPNCRVCIDGYERHK